MIFQLDSILARDTSEIIRFELTHVFLLKDARFPWVVLVPALEGLTEIHDLSHEDQLILMSEITRVSTALSTLYSPDKINIGALGNIVSQLHVHVIARFRNDPAWPGPVWGYGRAEPYEPDGLEKAKVDILAALSSELVE